MYKSLILFCVFLIILNFLFAFANILVFYNSGNKWSLTIALFNTGVAIYLVIVSRQARLIKKKYDE